MTRWNTVALGVLLGLFWVAAPLVAEAGSWREAAAHAPAHGRHHRAAKVSRLGHSQAAARPGRVQKGKASIYAMSLQGRKMADGTRFNPASNAAASKTLPLGTTARVTNLRNGRATTVWVRDRGPHRAGRIMDVSPSSAGVLGMKRDGVAPVAVVPLAPPPAPTIQAH